MGITETVKAICSYLSGVDIDRIGDDQSLHDDLDLDSLDRLELIMRVEEAFDIEIPDADVDAMVATPAGVASYVARRLNP